MSARRRNTLPSPTQAKYIARLWGGEHTCAVTIRKLNGGEFYNTPTTTILIRRNWLAPKGMTYFENGFEWQPHEVTRAGLLALEEYLCETRCKTMSI